MGDTYNAIANHVRLASALGRLPNEARQANDPEMLHDLLVEQAQKYGVPVERLARQFSHSNFENVDWWELNLAGMCFRGCSLVGGDMSRVKNIDQAQFDFWTRTELNYTDVVSGVPEGWPTEPLKLPLRAHLRELKFRDFDPERDLVTTVARFGGYPRMARSEIEEVNFYDLDVAGMDFSWLTSFCQCDFSQVRNIDKATFPDLGRDMGHPKGVATNKGWFPLNRFPDGVSYFDLQLVPPKRPREWVLE